MNEKKYSCNETNFKNAKFTFSNKKNSKKLGSTIKNNGSKKQKGIIKNCHTKFNNKFEKTLKRDTLEKRWAVNGMTKIGIKQCAINNPKACRLFFTSKSAHNNKVQKTLRKKPIFKINLGS